MGRDQVLLNPATGAVSVREVSRRFGEVLAVANVSLDIRRGEFVSLLGPSGCGKTTLLRMIAGLDRDHQGEVWVDRQNVTSQPPNKRPVNLVFQRYALFPHKSVGQNVGFALMLRRVPSREIARKVDAMLELVHLGGFADRGVEQLSGGQAQRVAMARALIDDPPVLLLDEPLAALDLKLRQAMQLELREIQRRVGSTFLYVTHDQEEALVMSDRVVLMDQGHIVQQGVPEDVYHRPTSVFVARFLGEANLFKGVVNRNGDDVFVDADDLRLTIDGDAGQSTGEMWVCVRPERIQIAASVGAGGGAREPNTARGKVVTLVFLGSLVRYTIATSAHTVLVEFTSANGHVPFREGDDVVLSWDKRAAVVVSE